MPNSNRSKNSKVSQSVRIRDIRTTKGSVNITQSAANSYELGDKESLSDFVHQVTSLLTQLDKLPNSSSEEVVTAKEDLSEAAKEAGKPSPDETIIKRFLRSAKGAISDLGATVPQIVTILTGISTLIEYVPKLFGK